MPNVQVSNTRRVVFTAMALVVFAILTYRSYWISSEFVYETLSQPYLGSFTDGVTLPAALLIPGVMMLAPLLFLLISISNRLRVKSRWMLTSAVLFFSTTFIALWLGRIDAVACMDLYYTESGQLPSAEPPEDLTSLDRATWQSGREFAWMRSHPQRFLAGLSSLPDRQRESWPWLLIPFLATAAFVIYGAWRSAVRDRGQGDVEEVVD